MRQFTGLSRSRFYFTWSGMNARCDEKKHPYHKKGIVVCKEWKNFTNFMKDMYKPYLEHCDKFGEKETQIDRINNKKGYFKENCRWATSKEQQNNRTNNIAIRFLTDIDGEKISLIDFSKKYNIKVGLIIKSIKEKFSVEELIKTSGKPSRLPMISYQEAFKERPEVLNKLPEKCKIVLELRYGLNDDKFRTLDEIGKELKLTKERIRQLENKGISLFFRLL